MCKFPLNLPVVPLSRFQNLRKFSQTESKEYVRQLLKIMFVLGQSNQFFFLVSIFFVSSIQIGSIPNSTALIFKNWLWIDHPCSWQIYQYLIKYRIFMHLNCVNIILLTSVVILLQKNELHNSIGGRYTRRKDAKGQCVDWYWAKFKLFQQFPDIQIASGFNRIVPHHISL